MTGYIGEIPRGQGYAFASTNDGPGWAVMNRGDRRPLGRHDWDGRQELCEVLPAIIYEWQAEAWSYGARIAPATAKRPDGSILRCWVVL